MDDGFQQKSINSKSMRFDLIGGVLAELTNEVDLKRNY
jgi:hypothetical protein